MKKNIKRYLSFALALVVVAASGKFAADHFLKATDGEENIVDEEVYEAYVEEQVVAEEVVNFDEICTTEEVVEGSMESEAVCIEETEAVPDTTEEECTKEEADSEEAKLEEADLEENNTEDTISESIDESLEEAIPEEEMEMEGMEEEIIPEVPERAVVVSCSLSEDGETVVFTSSLSGFDDVTVQYQWQVDEGNGWVDISGAVNDTFSLVIDENNAKNMYRLHVDVLDEM